MSYCAFEINRLIPTCFPRCLFGPAFLMAGMFLFGGVWRGKHVSSWQTHPPACALRNRLRRASFPSCRRHPFTKGPLRGGTWKEKGVASQEEEPGFSRTATPELPACALKDSHVPACVADGTPAGRRLIARPTTLSSLRAVR